MLGLPMLCSGRDLRNLNGLLEAEDILAPLALKDFQVPIRSRYAQAAPKGGSSTLFPWSL